MNFHVTNESIKVCAIQVGVVTASSVLKIGDTQSIQTFSALDTPLEALEIGPFAPIAPKG